MEGVGAFLGLFAVYLGYCSLSSFRPLRLLTAIVAQPTLAGQIITDAKTEVQTTSATTANDTGLTSVDPNTVSTNLAGMSASTSGSNTAPSGNPTPAQIASYQAYANQAGKSIFGSNWSPTQMADLILLWNKESGWRPNADNSSSGAYGIPQELKHSVPAGYKTNPQVQIQWGLQYIQQRYGTPQAAWAHEVAYNWY